MYMQRIFFPAFIATLVMVLFVAQVAPRNLQNSLNLGGQAPVEIVEEEVKEKSVTEHKFVLSIYSFHRNLAFLVPAELSPQTYLSPSLKPPRLS
jgi:hypothetical protein